MTFYDSTGTAIAYTDVGENIFYFPASLWYILMEYNIYL